MTRRKKLERQPRPRTVRRLQGGRIVVVGANFAGLTVAQRLCGVPDVTLVDRSPWFEWLPNVHELVSGVKTPADLRLSRRRILRAIGHRFVQAEVEAVDPAAGRVVLAGGRSMGFDVCVVATGGVNNTFGVPGADRWALPFKTVAECDLIGRKLAALVRRSGPVSVVIVGGGLEGVEALGEVLRRYRGRAGLSVRVVETARRLLPGTPRVLDTAVRGDCEPYAVRFDTGRSVTRVTKGAVHLDDGEVVPSDLTVWTGGVTAPPLLRESGLSDKPGQWAAARNTLQSRRFENVLVAGDAAALPVRLGKQAYYAMQMGECAAENAKRLLTGTRLDAFVPSAKPMLVALGDIDTFLVAGRTVLAGTALAAAKEAVFQLSMAQLDRPADGGSLGAAGRRGLRALQGLFLPGVTSLSALLRLPRVRILR